MSHQTSVTESGLGAAGGFVISSDGTRIGYQRYGSGPALILVQGAMGTTHSYRDLAKRLARHFTVYVPERRGRPLSPSEYRHDHVVQQEIDDLSAVFERSGAQRLFGLSSGAIIALEAARSLACVSRLILYEAPLYVSPQRMRFDLVARYYDEIEAGKLAPAMLTALLASGLAPRLLETLPRWFLDPLFDVVLALMRVDPGETIPPCARWCPRCASTSAS